MQSSQQSPARPVLSGVVRREAIEDMAGAVRQFFDLEAVQLEPGPCRCQIDFVAAGSTFFYYEQYPLRTHLTGELLGNRFGLAIPQPGPGLKFSGEEMDYCRLASAMTGEELDVHASRGLKQFVIIMDHERLLTLAEEIGLPAPVQRALRPGRSTMPLVAKPQAVAALSRGLADLLRHGAAGELLIDAESLEDWIYAETLSILDVAEAPLGRPSAAVLVRRATEIVDAHRGPLRIAALSRTLRVSQSTLENAFRNVAGVGPHAFFLRRRLNHARSVLLREEPGRRKVTEIAGELGFSELGRFAVRYRQMFGETPSETLRRRSGTMIAMPA
jgi:AraC-like DNA-binding protein